MSSYECTPSRTGLLFYCPVMPHAPCHLQLHAHPVRSDMIDVLLTCLVSCRHTQSDRVTVLLHCVGYHLQLHADSDRVVVLLCCIGSYIHTESDRVTVIQHCLGYHL